jgi:uncharacterized membrane protein
MRLSRGIDYFTNRQNNSIASNAMLAALKTILWSLVRSQSAWRTCAKGARLSSRVPIAGFFGMISALIYLVFSVIPLIIIGVIVFLIYRYYKKRKGGSATTAAPGPAEAGT